MTSVGPRVYRVEVREDDGDTTHEVTVPEGYAERLGVTADEATLVAESFRFLLEREPKESILASFELPVIARYFPAYEREIGERL